jgi:hypothetical protein
MHPRNADQFFTLSGVHLIFSSAEVLGTWNGDHVIADRVYWLEE